MRDRPYNVLFLCTHNSARSIIAECVMNRLAPDKFKAYSAGSQPSGRVHPYALDLLESLNYDTSGLRSKSWEEYGAGRARARFRVHRLRQCRQRGVPGLARPTHDRPLGPGRSLERRGQRGRAALRLRRHAPHADPAHQHLHELAARLARSAHAQERLDEIGRSRWTPRARRRDAMPRYSRAEVGAEVLGTALLLATVIGSGIMGERLAGGNVAIALLGNTIPTGAILIVLITMLGPISGAHFNPAVTAVFLLRKEIEAAEAGAYIAVQIAGGLLGVLAAHLMFDEAVLQVSTKVRAGPAQWFSEWVATFGLVRTILLTLRASDRCRPWPSASTSRQPTGSLPRPPSPILRSRLRAPSRTRSPAYGRSTWHRSSSPS